MLTNDLILIINLIDQMDTYFVMSKNKAISSVANTIKNTYSENMHLIHKQDYDKDNKIYI